MKPRKSLKWVKEGIQVRIVSKKVLSGKLYNKVLPVTTVLDQYSFEVFSDELNRPITDLREKDIEREPRVNWCTTCRYSLSWYGMGVFMRGLALSIDQASGLVPPLHTPQGSGLIVLYELFVN